MGKLNPIVPSRSALAGLYDLLRRWAAAIASKPSRRVGEIIKLMAASVRPKIAPLKFVYQFPANVPGREFWAPEIPCRPAKNRPHNYPNCLIGNALHPSFGKALLRCFPAGREFRG